MEFKSVVIISKYGIVDLFSDVKYGTDDLLLGGYPCPKSCIRVKTYFYPAMINTDIFNYT